jgi:translation initiation factor 4E
MANVDAKSERTADNLDPSVDMTLVDPQGKHLLENSWVIWYDSRKLHQQGSQDDWFANLQTVAVFNTVEDFWRTYNHIKRPSDLENGSNYHLFKKGIKPMWEDERNRNGGKWVINLVAKEDANRVDELWELLTLSMIGEYLDDGVTGDQICGAVISRRKAGTRISVWTKERDNRTSLMNIGKRLRSTLKITDKTPLEFQTHADSLASGSSYQNQVALSC